MARIRRDDYTFVTNNRTDFTVLYGQEELHTGLIIFLLNVTPSRQRNLFRAALSHIAKRGLTNAVLEMEFSGITITCREYSIEQVNHTCATMPINMTRKSRLGRFFGLLYVGLFLVVSGLWLIHAQQKQESNFTGNIKRIEDDSKPGIAHIHFDPGARTKWHSHEGGQIILVEEGVGRTQVKGGPVLELHAGETTYAAPGVAHWHGAAPDQGATQFNVQRGATTWLDAVAEKDYRTPPKR